MTGYIPQYVKTGVWDWSEDSVDGPATSAPFTHDSKVTFTVGRIDTPFTKTPPQHGRKERDFSKIRVTPADISTLSPTTSKERDYSAKITIDAKHNRLVIPSGLLAEAIREYRRNTTVISDTFSLQNPLETPTLPQEEAEPKPTTIFGRVANRLDLMFGTAFIPRRLRTTISPSSARLPDLDAYTKFGSLLRKTVVSPERFTANQKRVLRLDGGRNSLYPWPQFSLSLYVIYYVSNNRNFVQNDVLARGVVLTDLLTRYDLTDIDAIRSAPKIARVNGSLQWHVLLGFRHFLESIIHDLRKNRGERTDNRYINHIADTVHGRLQFFETWKREIDAAVQLDPSIVVPRYDPAIQIRVSFQTNLPVLKLVRSGAGGAGKIRGGGGGTGKGRTDRKRQPMSRDERRTFYAQKYAPPTDQ